jgi:hypothetical protein
MKLHHRDTLTSFEMPAESISVQFDEREHQSCHAGAAVGHPRRPTVLPLVQRSAGDRIECAGIKPRRRRAARRSQCRAKVSLSIACGRRVDGLAHPRVELPPLAEYFPVSADFSPAYSSDARSK